MLITKKSKLESLLLTIGILVFCCGCTSDGIAGEQESTVLQQPQASYWNNLNEENSQYTDKYENVDELVVNVVGLQANGDCTIIQCGDIQILIDTASALGFKESYVSYDEDGNEIIEDLSAFEVIQKKIRLIMNEAEETKWDYIILSHPDEDHIGNVVQLLDWFTQEGWSVGTIIDYDFNEVIDSPDDFYKTKTAADYTRYREEFCERTGTEHFSAARLSVDNMVQEYRLGDNATLSVLYNYYDDYEVIPEEDNVKKLNNKTNDVSVCCLIQNGSQKLLFTGDLEERGEKKLVEFHEQLLENVTFFKAGHHGSRTSNKKQFVDIIRPAYVAITYEKEVSNIEESINNFLAYTDNIYPSYVKIEETLNELYGDTFYYFDGKDVKVDPNYNNSEDDIQQNPSIFDATTRDDINWYRMKCEEGTICDKLYTYTFDESIVSYNPEMASKYYVEGNKGSYINCTLVKYGHYDIVIDCGSTNEVSSVLVDKLRSFVVDGVIECLIVTHFQDANISQIIGGYDLNGPIGNGIFDKFRIEKLIDNKWSAISVASSTGFYTRYLSRVDEVGNHIKLGTNENYSISLTNDLCVSVYGSGNGTTSDEDSYSLISVVDFFDNKLLFVGDQMNYSNLPIDEELVSDVVFMRLPGISINPDKGDGYTAFLQNANPSYSVIGTPIDYVLPSGQTVYSSGQIEKTLDIIYGEDGNNEVYACGCIDSSKDYFVPIDGEPGYYNGDLVFTISYNSSTKENRYEMKRVYSNHKAELVDTLVY